MDKKKILTFLTLFIIVIILGFVVWRSSNKKNNLSSEVKLTQTKTPIFFYGSTCPHCADIEAWMRKNEIEKKITIIKKEVYNNRQNAKELVEAAKTCGLPTDSIGVPFLYAQGKCFIGTPEVINFLSQKAGIKEEK